MLCTYYMPLVEIKLMNMIFLKLIMSNIEYRFNYNNKFITKQLVKALPIKEPQK